MIQHRYLDERQFVFNAAWLLLCVFGVALPAGAQIPPPDPRYLFREDEKEFQRYQKAIVERAITADSPRSESLDFQAPEVEYRKESNEIVGSGGVVISKGGIQAQAQKARANTETEDLALIDNVLVAAPDASIGAERGKFNLNTETGSFENARFVYENGNYGITAEELSKVDEFSYQLFRPVLSTCHCADGKLPWSIRCGRATVTQEGYAHTYSTTLNIYDVPILYSPWFAFPVKEERQTGLLVPLFGYSSEDGFGYTQPFYYVVDPNSDATLTPFIETETRLGTSLDFRRAFSRSHDLQTRVYFSDESARDGDLRGTVVDNLFDPTFDDNRFGGFYRQRWMPAPGGLPVSAIADINYVSDDLFLREIDAEDIARPNSRYVTSTALLRGSAGGMLSAEVGGEYNQSMETDDDVIFQRLPMATAMLTKSFRPFGYNPYGLRVTGRTRIVAVNFVRDDGYDGWRQEVIPGLRVPFHYRNFFESNLDANWYYTKYNLQETQDPYDANVLLDDSNSRNLPIIDYRVGTVLERVFPVSSSGFLATVTGLGAKNQDNNLVRVKHTIEPTISYRYVPEEDQDDLPLFDSRDRIEEKSLFTYGLRSALYGRFLPRRGAGEEIAELTPYVEELPMLEPQEPVTFGDAGSEGLRLPGVAIARRLGEVREIATAQVFQSYDAALDSEEEKESGRDSLSDVFVAASVFPSQYFGLGADSNVDHRDNSLSSWSLQTAFFDDRNDALRGRYTFVDGGVDQMEGNAELVLTEAVKLAYYARYDNDEGEFIEQQGVIRFLSSCNCWHFDLGVNDQINPDRQRLTLRFTFTGLGDITQDISTNRRGQ